MIKKPIILVLILCLFSAILYGQSVTFFPNANGVKVVKSAGDTLRNPWAGGMSNPTFSNIDLNFDGKQDLFIFDHADSTISTYINEGNDANGKPIYRYAPEYVSFFPQLKYWAFLVDYNHDGLPDIFAYSQYDGGASFEIWKNTSINPTISFKLMKGYLTTVANPVWTFPSNLYTDNADMPAFVDIDGDGDIDILSQDPSQTQTVLYKNRSFDKYGKNYVQYDSLNFEENDDIWGAIQGKGGSVNTATDSAYAPYLGRSGDHYYKMRHAGSNITLMDADGDGDMDMVWSDVNGSGLCLLHNARVESKLKYDSITKYDSMYLNHSCNYYPGAFHADINGDKRRDLIVSPLQIGGSEDIHNVFYYRNQGSDIYPSFVYEGDSFLQEDEIDLGSGAVPAFLDDNGDGIPEYLAVATHGNIKEPFGSNDRLVLYKNLNPTKGNSVFQKVDNNWLSINKLGLSYLTVTFGDMDGDGKQDMLLGQINGKLLYYHNKGTGSSDNFVRETNPVLDTIDVGDMSAPAIADLDGDGTEDLVVGNLNGSFNYYRGLGYKTVGTQKYLDYQFITHYLGNVFTIDTSYLTSGFRGASSPVIADFDKNGKLDLLSGSGTGSLFLYMDIQNNLKGTFTRDTNFLYSPLQKKYELPRKSFGAIIHPAVAFLDGDSLPDIIIGNKKGGMYFYSSHPPIPTITSIATQEKSSFRIYPNPANQTLNIYATQGLATYRIINMLGQTILTGMNNATLEHISIDISKLPNGVYCIELSNAKGDTSMEKVVIKR